MGFIVLLKFSLLCIDFLAWPVIALGYPLFASVRAIESGSVYHLRKLVIYWTLFSLISLFDYAFVKIIEWIPFWSSIKLVVVCWLVLPRFQGAYYSYQRLIRPCLVVNLQEAIGSLYKPKEEQEQPRAKEMILDVVEKYLQENGSEALEMIIARKVSYKMDSKEPSNSPKNKVMEPDVKNVVIASKQLKELDDDADDDDHNHKGKEMLKSPKKIAATEATKQCQHAQPVTSFWVPKETTYVAAKPKDTIKPQTETSAEIRKPMSTHHPTLKESSVEQEWTCPLCHVVTTSENDLKVHLSGKKHKSMCDSLKSSKLTAKPKDSITPPTETSAENRKPTSPHHPPLKKSSVGQEWSCPPCQVVTTSENDLKIHLSGKKHKSLCESLKSSKLSALDTGPSTHHPPLKKSSVEQEWMCPLCQVVTTCENNLKMHLSGKKHKSMCESLKSSKLTALATGPSSTSSPSPLPKVKRIPFFRGFPDRFVEHAMDQN